MNKTWSIILIVVASIVVLGGTYWYFGMQKSKNQEKPTTSAVVENAKIQPPIAKANAVVPTIPKKEPTLYKQIVEPKVTPVAESNPAEQAVKETLPAETPKAIKRLPAPIAPIITMNGGFALPSFGDTSEKAEAEKEAQTSVLSSKQLPPKTEESILPLVGEEKRKIEPGPAVVQEEIPVVVQEKIPAVTEGPVASLPEAEQSIAATVVEMAPTTNTPIMITAVAEKMAIDDKKAIEANLSVSFLEYNFPRNFSSSEKSFTVSLDVMSQKEVFGWGGTLEVGRNTTTKVVQISLLGKTAWSLGKDVVTFPLSVSFGPTLFINSTANTTEFGMKGKLSAGVTYAISESFRMFYAIGIGATYNFSSPSFRFVLEPIRIGMGFSF